MNTLSESQLKSNDDIPTNDIEQDIADTKIEIDDYQDEKQILMRNPQGNKVRIYMLEGNIRQRQDFINKLSQILDYRKQEEKWTHY